MPLGAGLRCHHCHRHRAEQAEPRGLGLAGSFAFAPTKPAQSCSPGNFILGSGSGTQHPPQSISVKMIPNELYHETPLCWAVLPLHRGKSPNPHPVPTTAIPFCLSGFTVISDVSLIPFPSACATLAPLLSKAFFGEGPPQTLLFPSPQISPNIRS